MLVNSGVASYGARAPSTSNDFIFSSLWSKPDSQLSEYCVVCQISWCRCPQVTALSIGTALVTKLLVIEQLLHPALKFAVSAPWRNFQLCPFSQQILATPLLVNVEMITIVTSKIICGNILLIVNTKTVRYSSVNLRHLYFRIFLIMILIFYDFRILVKFVFTYACMFACMCVGLCMYVCFMCIFLCAAHVA